MTADKLVVALAGMPGSGKSLVVDTARKSGYDAVLMGDVVREEAKKRGVEPDAENIGKIMLELRQTEGKAVIARRCVPKVVSTTRQKVIVDGIRSLDEVEEFKRHFSKLVLMAVHASPETRFTRLFHRRRSDDAADWEVFHKRDTRELSVGLGNAIAMAEYVVVNEEPVVVVKRRARETLVKVERKWTR
ncbi:flagellar hook-basal body complex protein FliE [Candidatus Bathyarchaeota archaeon]|nr:flagellar hook-basal body complex protein FliE [Candidatus Bathyarchaeota archaeon]